MMEAIKLEGKNVEWNFFKYISNSKLFARRPWISRTCLSAEIYLFEFTNFLVFVTNITDRSSSVAIEMF